MMRFRLAFLAAALAAGCGSSTPDPCSGVTGVCLSARVEGSATGLDQLKFIVEMPAHKEATTPDPAQGFSLPVKVGLQLPDGTPSDFNLTTQGLSGGSVVAQAVEPVHLVNNRGSITIKLDANTAPDLLGVVDMGENADMHKPAITAMPSGTIMGAELQQLKLTTTINDPLGEAATASFSNLPTGATATQDGGLPTLIWTPLADQAGSYDVTLNVMPMDSARAFMQTFTIKVANVLDKLFYGPGDTGTKDFPVPTDIVGDWDGDGFTDVASCSASGSKYLVTIVFGDATGLPTSLPLPPARTKQISTPIGNPTDALRLQCTGGDLNGDKKSDIVLADPSAFGGKGMLFFVFGTTRTDPNPVVVEAMDPTPITPGEQLGIGKVLVADINGDQIDDVIATNDVGASKDTIYKFFGQPSPSPMPGGTFTTPDTTDNRAVSGCGHRILMAAGNVDGDAKNEKEILVYDPDLNSGGGTNCTGGGGVSVIGATGTDLYPHPADATLEPKWGSPNAQSTLCDVDGDGLSDLVVSDGETNGSVWIFFSNAGKFATTGSGPAILDAQAAAKLAAPSGQAYTLAACVPNFSPNARQTAVVAYPGSSGTSRADLLSKSRTPQVLASIPAPPAHPRFGSVFGGVGDVNGDSRGDLVVGASGGGDYYVVYGK